VNVAAGFAQMLKIFAQIMANFSALGMQPHPLHPHAVHLCARPFKRDSVVGAENVRVTPAVINADPLMKAL